MEITVYQDQDDLPIEPHSVRPIVEEVLSFEGSSPDEVIIHFISNEAMCELHAEYFDDPSPTDCITFPIDPTREGDYQLLGEVFVCPKVAIDSAASHSNTPLEECTLYLVHTLLHLLGFNDQNGEEKTVMREKEKQHMELLRKKNLLLKSSNP
jgi:probable rRNA maturation factor